MAATNKRTTGYTGFTIPVSKWRKLSGEPIETAKSTDYLLVPAGAIGRYPSGTWGQFGGVRTYHFWKDPKQSTALNLVPGSVLEQARNKGPPYFPRGNIRPSSGTGEPRGRGDPLPRVRNLQESDKDAAEILCNLRKDSGHPLRERKEGSTSPVRDELLDVCAEGGSQSSRHWSCTSDEEDEERDLSGGDRSCGEGECSGSDGSSECDGSDGLCSEDGQSDEESDCASGQEDEGDCSAEEGD